MVRQFSKRCLREGEGWEKPRDAARVTLAVDAAVDSSAVDGQSAQTLPGFEKQSLNFIVGNGDVCDALEFAVCEMKKGERALLICNEPASCAEPRLGLQEVSTGEVTFTLELLDFHSGCDTSVLSEEERLEHAMARKDVGARLFKTGRTELALGRYSKVLEIFGYVENLSSPNKARALELRRACSLNMAACQLRLQDFQAAKSSCSDVLHEDSCNVKALFRRAQACLELGEPDVACKDLRQLTDRDPQNKEARDLLKVAKARLKQDIRDADKQDRPTFSKMCEGLGKGPIPEPFKDPRLEVREDFPPPRKKKDEAPSFDELGRTEQDTLIGKLLTGPELEGEMLEKMKARDEQHFLESKAAWPDDDSDED